MRAGSAMPTREECGVESAGVPGGAVRFGPASKRIVLENYAGRDRTLSAEQVPIPAVDGHPASGLPRQYSATQNKTDPIITSMVISYANTAYSSLPKLVFSRRPGRHCSSASSRF